MIISIIVAVDERNGIGLQNRIPWHLPADLSRFKTLTMGHHLILGRKTFESISTPLSGRTLIVLSRNLDYQPEDCLTALSLQDSFRLAEAAGEREVFVIGGSEVYSEALPIADHLYLTRVHITVESDRSIPTIQEEDWTLICEQFHPADDKNQHPHTFFHYIRKRT